MDINPTSKTNYVPQPGISEGISLLSFQASLRLFAVSSELSLRQLSLSTPLTDNFDNPSL